MQGNGGRLKTREKKWNVINRVAEQRGLRAGGQGGQR